MAKVNQGQMKQWADGDTIHGPEYSQERDLIILAQNDTQQQIIDMKAGPSVTTTMIVNNAVTSDKIVNDAVTTAKIVNKAVTSEKLSDNSVTSAHIVDGTVGTVEIADAAVTDVKLAPNSVTGSKIPADTIGTNHIQSRSVLNHHLGDRSVTPEKVTPEVVTNLAYTKEETDSQISAALSEGVPQEVIDQIKASVASDIVDFRTELNGLNSEKINSLVEDAYGPTRVPVRGVDKPGVYVFKIGSSTLGSWKSSMGTTLDPAVLVEYRGAVGVNAVTTVQTVYTNTNESFTRTLNGTVWRSWTRNATYAEVTDVKTYVDERPWQKVPVTADNGTAINIAVGTDIHTYPWKTGFYMGNSLINAPNTAWYYFEVLKHNDLFITINAYNLDNAAQSFRQKKKTNGVWGAWSDDLFQSVSDGKAMLKGTIVTEKGGTVPQAGSTPTFAELDAGVKSIQQGVFQSVQPALGEISTVIAPGFTGVIRELSYIYPKVRLISGVRNSDTQYIPNKYNSLFYIISPDQEVLISVALRDIDGRLFRIGNYMGGSGNFERENILAFTLSMDTKTCVTLVQFEGDSYPTAKTTTIPSGFKSDNTMLLCIVVNSNTIPSGGRHVTVRTRCEAFTINTM